MPSYGYPTGGSPTGAAASKALTTLSQALLGFSDFRDMRQDRERRGRLDEIAAEDRERRNRADDRAEAADRTRLQLDLIDRGGGMGAAPGTGQLFDEASVGVQPGGAPRRSPLAPPAERPSGGLGQALLMAGDEPPPVSLGPSRRTGFGFNADTPLGRMDDAAGGRVYRSLDTEFGPGYIEDPEARTGRVLREGRADAAGEERLQTDAIVSFLVEKGVPEEEARAKAAQVLQGGIGLDAVAPAPEFSLETDPQYLRDIGKEKWRVDQGFSPTGARLDPSSPGDDPILQRQLTMDRVRAAREALAQIATINQYKIKDGFFGGDDEITVEERDRMIQDALRLGGFSSEDEALQALQGGGAEPEEEGPGYFEQLFGHELPAFGSGGTGSDAATREKVREMMRQGLSDEEIERRLGRP